MIYRNSISSPTYVNHYNSGYSGFSPMNYFVMMYLMNPAHTNINPTKKVADNGWGEEEKEKDMPDWLKYTLIGILGILVLFLIIGAVLAIRDEW